MTVNSAAGVVKLALLIDGDNVSATFMPLIMREAAGIGAVAVRRIYGQFKSGKMKSWLKHVDEYDLTPVNVSPLTRGKNATDMKLVIEAMDMLYGRQLDGFCIASSDGDFTPLAVRIRGNAVAVYGFGAKKAPAGYKTEFDRFYECDTLLAAEKKATPRRAAEPAAKLAAPATAKASPPRKPGGRSPGPTPAARQSAKPLQVPRANLPVPINEIRTAITQTTKKDGWSPLSEVGNHLQRAISDFDARNYGRRSISRLFSAMSDIETRNEGRNRVFVRLKSQ